MCRQILFLQNLFFVYLTKTRNMAVTVQRRLISVEEYRLMLQVGIMKEDDRVELINGEIINKIPIGSKHAGHVNWLHNLLSRNLESRAILAIQNPVHLGEHSEPESDISVLKFRADFYEAAHPQAEDILLLIEVADTSFDYDREIKLPIYSAAGVPEVWLINLNARQVEVYREPKARGYALRRTLGAGDQVNFPKLDWAIEVDQVFIS